MRRWRSGQNEVPAGVWRDLAALLAARAEEASALAARIEATFG
jgi:hypothetical protein